MRANILLVFFKSVGSDTSSGYTIGAVIALIILGYLLYSLVKPEKF